MEHKLGSACCLVYHGADENGNKVPSCRKCTVCGEWINTWNADTPCDLEARRERIRAHNLETKRKLAEDKARRLTEDGI